MLSSFQACRYCRRRIETPAKDDRMTEASCLFAPDYRRLSDTSSRCGTNRDANWCDGNIGNGYTRSTSIVPRPRSIDERFAKAAIGIMGKRLTYRRTRGQQEPAETGAT
jgi:hypothetical protein